MSNKAAKRAGIFLTQRELRLAKIGREKVPPLCQRELEAYLAALATCGSEAMIPEVITRDLRACMAHGKVSDVCCLD